MRRGIWRPCAAPRLGGAGSPRRAGLVLEIIAEHLSIAVADMKQASVPTADDRRAALKALLGSMRRAAPGSAPMKQASVSSTVQGGGKRRDVIGGWPNGHMISNEKGLAYDTTIVKGDGVLLSSRAAAGISWETSLLLGCSDSESSCVHSSTFFSRLAEDSCSRPAMSLD
jgi:hypothetical protein